MKKNYITPTVEVEEVQPVQIIAASTSFGLLEEATGSTGNDFNAPEDRFNWDNL